MSTLYGSFEYFQKQIENYQAIHKYEDIRMIWSHLKKEIFLVSFVEDEGIRQKYLHNLRLAVEHYKESNEK